MGKEQEPRASIAIVDDHAYAGEAMRRCLGALNCEIRVFTEAAACLTDLARAPVDIVITDLNMPKVGGLELLAAVKGAWPTTDVIIVTGQADKSSAIAALKAGAFDFFEKPVDAVDLVETVKRTVRYRQAVSERDRLAEELSRISRREAQRWGVESLIGESAVLQRVVHDIRLLHGPGNTTVLISGESGTGKELVARAIHFGSQKAARPFVAVNCAALSTELAGAALFGHVKGAFTGAVADHKGFFSTADGGTIFLDEIGDMNLAVQASLLRVLEDGVVTPVGAAKGHRVNVRVIAATNVELKARVAAAAFRTDLYYRLAGFTIELPPLRARAEDIPALASHFVRQLSSEMGLAPPTFSTNALTLLQGYRFPGNIRELRNLVERALIESGGRQITPECFRFLNVQTPARPAPPSGRADPPASVEDLPLTLREAEDAFIRRAVAACDGNLAAAARRLGVTRAKLYRRLAALPE